MMLVSFPRFGKLILLNWSLKPAVTRPPVNERNDICLFLLGKFTFALWYLLMYWPTMLEVRVLKLESLTSISSGFCYTCLMPFNCTAKMPVCENHGCQSLWLFWQHFLSRAHALSTIFYWRGKHSPLCQISSCVCFLHWRVFLQRHACSVKVTEMEKTSLAR